MHSCSCIFCIVKYHIGALTLRETVTLKLVNDTPQINGNNVTVDFTVSGPVAKVICTLDDKKIEEDCKN